jgi:hypothetical protein
MDEMLTLDGGTATLHNPPLVAHGSVQTGCHVTSGNGRALTFDFGSTS